MQVMIVGAKGYLGARLVRELSARGSDVVTVSSSIPGGIDPDTGLLPVDFVVPRTVRAVYYLAQSPLRSTAAGAAAHMLSVSVVSAVRLAEAARKAGVRRFIYTSTGNVYAPGFAAHAETSALCRDDWYALAKIHAEEALALFRGDMEVTIARLFGVYGPGQTGRLIPNLMDRVRAGQPVVLEDNPHEPGDHNGLRISLCHVDDVVRILLAMVSGVKAPVINVSSDEALSVRQIATEIGRAVGRAPVFERAARQRRGDLVANIALLRRELPMDFIPFSTGVREMLEERRTG